jgi:thioredoxin-like negative regulator of GroEL
VFICGVTRGVARVAFALAIVARAAASPWLPPSGGSSRQTASAEIRWETKLDRAVDAARETNQPVLIEFWATWCEVCRDMDRDVYTDERVAAAMAKVRPVKVDIDREPGLKRKYEVDGTPTLIVADSYGRELFRYLGALPPDRLRQLLDALPADIGAINRYSAALTAKKDDFPALSGLARELRAAGFYRTSSDYCDRALRTKDGRRPGAARDELQLIRTRNAEDLERARQARATPRG